MAANGNAEFQRLVSLYESNSANFQKAFGITIGFGLFIALTVLLPYYLNIYEIDQNRLQINNETETTRNNNFTYYQKNSSAQKLNNSIQNLKDTIDSTNLMMNTRIKEAINSLSEAKKLLPLINDPAIYERLTNMLNKTNYQGNKTIEREKAVLASFHNAIKMLGDGRSNKTQKLHTIENQINISGRTLEMQVKPLNLSIVNAIILLSDGKKFRVHLETYQSILLIYWRYFLLH